MKKSLKLSLLAGAVAVVSAGFAYVSVSDAGTPAAGITNAAVSGPAGEARRHEGMRRRAHFRGRGGPGGFRGGPRGGFRGGRMFETFDANDDGRITQAEIDAFRKGQFDEHDANKDGKLTLQEYQNLWLAVMRERMVDAFQRHDDDGNAEVTLEEFSERFSRMVRRLDGDGDGAITRDDLRSRFGNRGGPRDGRRGERRGPGQGQGQGQGGN